jgi:hypothetical protein
MRITFVTFLFLIALKISGQNLVPNGSFESYFDCSQSNHYIPNAFTWNGFETPDYFNSCINSTFFFNTDVPLNYFGYQNPNTGNAYVGILTYYGGNAREFIYNKLSNPLTSNKSYCTSFKISLSDSTGYAINKLGIYLSSDTIVSPYITTSSPPFYSFTYYNPQIESNVFITDTSDWTEISGTYLAQGNEEIITIGNFRDNAGTDTSRVRNTTVYPYSYYYIDDVSVEEVVNANAGPDAFLMQGDSIQLGNNPTENANYSWFPSTGISNPNAPNPKASPSTTITYVLTKTQCNVVTTDTVLVDITVGTDSKNKGSKINIYPNPSNENFILEYELDTDGQIDIYSITGEVVRSQFLRKGKESIKIEAQDMEQGVYYYMIITKETNPSSGKLIILK